MIDVLGVVVNRIFDYIESFFKWISRRNHSSQRQLTVWHTTKMPVWVREISNRHIRSGKSFSENNIFLKGSSWHYNIIYRVDNGRVKKCLRRLRYRSMR